MSTSGIENKFAFLTDAISGLYVSDKLSESSTPWRISPKPFTISTEIYQEVCELGLKLAAFYRASNKLYFQSLNGQVPAFVAKYLEQGKPEYLKKIMRSSRFKNKLPNVIRPDLLLTDSGLVASELDNIPGGMGFVTVMSKAYSELGYSVVAGKDGMQRGFSNIFKHALPLINQPKIAIMISDEASAYLPEFQSFAEMLRKGNYLEAYVCHPRDLVYTQEQIFITLNEQKIAIDGIYRFFELYDLANIPKHELILYAVLHNEIMLTPPLKANMEEKLLFSFLWHPSLESFWQKELGEEEHAQLCKYLPRTWVLDPEPLPPQACIVGLEANGKPVFSWNELGTKYSQKNLNYVIKPSGFNELAWGARGVKIGNNLSKKVWNDVMDQALHAFEQTPHVLQDFQKSKVVVADYYHPVTKEITPLNGKIRLCPYYFTTMNNEVYLGGILATICPEYTDIIHGASEAIMTVCTVV